MSTLASTRASAPPGWGRFRLPQHEALRDRGARAMELEQLRERYVWRLVPGLPSTLVEMPESERFGPAKQRRIQSGFTQAAWTLTRVGPKVLRSRWRSLDTFDSLPPKSRQPASVGRWRSDAEFARQRLMGVNPVVIRRCEQLPSRFGLDARALERRVGGGLQIEAALAEGRIFACDYAMLEGLSCVAGRFLPAPIGLFHSSPRGLMPLAIQLGQDPSRDSISTPTSPTFEWLRARLFLAVADGHHHQFVTHLLRCHYEPEPFVIATRRQLHPRHPVHELLAPHFRWLFAINAVARAQAASDRGSFGRMESTGMIGGNELMRRSYGAPFADRTFVATLEARGLASADALPGYLFRDDALALHAAIARFVAASLVRIYPDPGSLHADAELQAWAAELVDPERGRVVGLPGGGRIESLAQLEAICTELIFRMSAWHTGTSHGQYDHYANVINAPNGLHGDRRAAAGEVDEAALVRMVPKRAALDQLAAAIAAGTEPMHTLLAPREAQWAGAPALMALRVDFGRELRSLHASVAARNAGLEQGYASLDPAHVCEGVTV